MRWDFDRIGELMGWNIAIVERLKQYSIYVCHVARWQIAKCQMPNAKCQLAPRPPAPTAPDTPHIT